MGKRNDPIEMLQLHYYAYCSPLIFLHRTNHLLQIWRVLYNIVFFSCKRASYGLDSITIERSGLYFPNPPATCAQARDSPHMDPRAVKSWTTTRYSYKLETTWRACRFAWRKLKQERASNLGRQS